MTKRLGKGSYGSVYHGICNPSGTETREVAVKVNVVEAVTAGISALRELDILCKCQTHPHIIRLDAIYFEKPFADEIDLDDPLRTRVDPLFPIMEFASEGNLVDLIVSRTRSWGLLGKSRAPIYDGFTTAELLEMTFQILTAIEFTHGLGVIHRDLKPHNFVVMATKPRPILKLVDFGLSRSTTSQGCMSPKITTYPYRDPKICWGAEQYGPEVDAWSVGCILFELVMGRRFVGNLPDDDNSYILREIYRIHPEPLSFERLRQLADPNSGASRHFNSQPRPKWRDILPANLDVGYAEMIINLLQMDPDKRWSIKQALESLYWKQWQGRLTELRKDYPIQRKSFVYQVRHENYPYCSALLNNLVEIANASRRREWFNFFVIFVTVNLIYRVTENIDSDTSKLISESTFHAYVLLYMVVKYDGCMRVPPSWNDFAPPCYHDQVWRQHLISCEQTFLRAAKLQVYSLTPYDVVTKRLTEDERVKLLTHLVSKPREIHGKTPQEIAAEVLPGAL